MINRGKADDGADDEADLTPRSLDFKLPEKLKSNTKT